MAKQEDMSDISQGELIRRMTVFFFFFPAVLGLELMAFTLSHSARPIFVKGLTELYVGAGFKLRSS
jgi:hypothetical protein